MKVDVIKAWKDAEYRSSLSTEQLATIEMPVMSEVDQSLLMGGVGSGAMHTISGECNGTGASCNTAEGLIDQLNKWFL